MLCLFFRYFTYFLNGYKEIKFCILLELNFIFIYTSTLEIVQSDHT